MAAFTVRIAESDADRYRVFRLRYDIYIEEMRKTIAAADHRARILTEPIDAASVIFVVERDGHTIGTARITLGDRVTSSIERMFDWKRFAELPRETMSVTSRVMIGRHFRGSGALPALLGKLYDYAHVAGLVLNFCHCRPSLVSLYEKLGFRRYKPSIIDPEAGFQIPLVLAVAERARLKTIEAFS